MRQLFFTYFIFLLCSFPGKTQQIPKHEFRGVWIVSLSNIDWPSKQRLPIKEQQKEFTALLDQYQAMNLNAVIVQVRPLGDALYQSDIVPWSQFLTGEQDKDPGYDPLEFMVKECHQRGLEFHAWFNPFRLQVSHWSDISDRSPIKSHPEWVVDYGGLKMLDPGIPAVRKYMTNIVAEVATNYAIDAVHFDDYFYPYQKKQHHFADDNTYEQFHRDQQDTLAWRRENINLLISSINDTLRSIDPELKFGISPFGIWRNLKEDPRGSNTNGTSSYDEHYADSRKWLEEGWIDYVIPQIYWPKNHATAPYDTLVDWWSRHSFGRGLYIGQSVYKVGEESWPLWQNSSEIPSQISTNRTESFVGGQAFFNSNQLLDNPLGLTSNLISNQYKLPALVPPMPWLDSIPPNVPRAIKVVRKDSIHLISWIAPSKAEDNDRASHYVVYQFDENHWLSKDNPENILAILPENTTQFKVFNPKQNAVYGITALDNLSNESPILTEDQFVSVKSAIEKITLFPDHGQVHRIAKVSLKPGQTHLQIPHLSGKINKSSIIANCPDDVQIVEMGISKHHFIDPDLLAKEDRISDELRSVQHVLEKKRDSLNFLQKVEIMIMRNNRNFGKDKSVSTKEVKQMANFFVWKMNEISSGKKRLKKIINTYTIRELELSKALNDLEAKKAYPENELEIVLNTDRAIEFDLELTYLIHDAYWKPSYDLDIFNQNSAAQLHYKAYIYQNTGINWDNVNVVLASRHSIQQLEQLPELRPILVSGNYDDQDSLIQEEIFAYDESQASNELEAMILTSAVDTTSSYVNLPLKTPIKLASSKEQKLVYVQKENIPLKYMHHSVPSISQNSFLTGIIADWEHLHLRSGEINVYIDGTFWNTSLMNINPNVDTLEFVLGREEEVTTNRIITSSFTERKLLGLYTKETVLFEIEVKNVKTEEVSIVLEDQIPVSPDNRIKIKPSLGTAELNQQTGTLSWQIDLPPNGSQKLQFGYIMKYPSSMELVYE